MRNFDENTITNAVLAARDPPSGGSAKPWCGICTPRIISI